MSVEHIAKRLKSLSNRDSAGEIKQLAGQFSDEVMAHDMLPDAYLDLLVEILASAELCAIPETSDFFVPLLVEPPSISEKQIARIIDVVKQAYRSYENEEFCLVICDLVARKAAPSASVSAFEAMANTPHKSGLYAVAVGLETVLRHVDTKASIYKSARTLYERVMAG